MPVYAYAICASAPFQLPAGIQQSLVAIAQPPLTLVAEADLDLRLAKEAELIEAVVAHDRIVCALFAQTPLLPIRFGTHFESIAAVTAHLAAERDRYLSQLAALGDHAEYCLKLTPTDAPDLPEASGSGRAYFQAKKDRVTRLSQWQAAQAEAKTAWITHLETLGAHIQADAAGLRAYFLAAPTQLPEWDSDPYWQLELSGTLPPYHFVDDLDVAASES